MPNAHLPTHAPTAQGSILLRLVWTAIGPAGLFFLAAIIATTRPPGFTRLDLIFWGLAIVVVLARVIDVKKGHGVSADGSPVSSATLRRFAVVTMMVSAAGWGLAHGIARVLGT